MAAPDAFAKNVQDWTRGVDARIALDARQVAFKLFEKVILKTPVDTGAARNSWGVSVGAIRPPTPSAGAEAVVSSGGIGAMSVAVAASPVGGVVWLSNGLPYIRVLEYGLYPNPPQRGSWVKGRKGQPGHWEIKSVNGYSRQAPQGMVRLSIIEMQTEFST